MGALFVTFEGGEGAGKTTLINSLQAFLQKEGREVVVTREPGSTSLGEAIRDLLLNQAIKPTQLSEVLLFLAARAQHIEEVITPSLLAGKIVLCDRFNDSTIAYQGAARGLGEERISKWCEEVCGKLKPDLTFFLDLDPKIGFERVRKASRALDRMEKERIEFHQKVRSAFLQIAERETQRVVILEASQPAESVLAQAQDHLKKKFKNV